MPAEKQVRDVMLNPERMIVAEYERNEWMCTAAYGTTVEDVLLPGYWAHVAPQLKPYDHIEVRVDDGAWLLQLLVVDVSRSWARVHVLAQHMLTTADVSLTEAERHEVRFKGAHYKYCVIRNSDGAVVKDKFSKKEEAYLWMHDHEKTTA